MKSLQLTTVAVADFIDGLGFLSSLPFSGGESIVLILAARQAKHMIGMPCREHCVICHDQRYNKSAKIVLAFNFAIHFVYSLKLGVHSLANASRARQFNPLNPPGVGWVKFVLR